MTHRVSHFLFLYDVPFIPRLLSEVSRLINGIDIHPGAQIGKDVVIDHGLGVVIGETSVVGNSVILYQGVTLGGTRRTSGKRHPTLEDHVLVGAGAKILGNITVGAYSRIGANSVVTKDIPPYTTAVGVPAVSLTSETRIAQEAYRDYMI